MAGGEGGDGGRLSKRLSQHRMFQGMVGQIEVIEPTDLVLTEFLGSDSYGQVRAQVGFQEGLPQSCSPCRLARAATARFVPRPASGNQPHPAVLIMVLGLGSCPSRQGLSRGLAPPGPFAPQRALLQGQCIHNLCACLYHACGQHGTARRPMSSSRAGAASGL